MRQLKRSTIFISLIGILAMSTIFFHFVEGWGWVDSYFFTVITISTVGYGKLVPITTAGKLATTFLIFSGLGVFALAIREFAQYHMQKREEHTEWLVAHLRITHEEHEEVIANEDDPPRHRSR